MSTGPLTLFLEAFFCNPFDFRSWVALREKGLDFTVSRVMLGEGHELTAGYKVRSVTARVPGLAHADFFLAESSAIVEYLEEVFPAPDWPALLPADVRARARARQLLSFLGADLSELIAERPAWTLFYPGARPPLSARARSAADELLAIATRVIAEGLLDTWSLVSADLSFALLRLARSGETLPPDLQAVVDENLARPSVSSYLDHDRPPNPPTTGRRVRI